MKDPCVIRYGDCLISSEILTEKFCCDYARCKGICCVIGDSGAPLEEDETEAIERNYDQFSDLMEPAGREAVEREGFFEIDRDGDIVTPLIRETGSDGNADQCAYCRRDADGNCLCTMEVRWGEGRGDFRKPVSCWLYPIRITRLASGLRKLELHRWNICKDAFKKGARENVPVYRFLREPITKYFGEDFYNALEAAAEQLA